MVWFAQHLTIQELPETAPPGQLPRSCEIILEYFLVYASKECDRIAIVGIYKVRLGSTRPSFAVCTTAISYTRVLLLQTCRQVEELCRHS